MLTSTQEKQKIDNVPEMAIRIKKALLSASGQEQRKNEVLADVLYEIVERLDALERQVIRKVVKIAA